MSSGLLYYFKKGCILAIAISVNIAIYAQEKFQYTLGFSLESELFRPNQIIQESHYMHTTNTSGAAIGGLVTNRLFFKDWFLELGLAHNTTFEKQDIVFSSPVDFIIDNRYNHVINNWRIDYGIGKQFKLKSGTNLTLGLGISTVGFYTRWIPKRGVHTGSFVSTYPTASPSWGITDVNYTYEMTYEGKNLLSPYVRFGVYIPVNKGYFEWGCSARLNRMHFVTHLVIKSSQYTALGKSVYDAHAVGIYLTYHFGIRKQ